MSNNLNFVSTKYCVVIPLYKQLVVFHLAIFTDVHMKYTHTTFTKKQLDRHGEQ